ncbi:hypothetical protein ACIBO5_31670 [Nonomuraea angiospora]|uniref:hypothetical protein n=1 Tax=Nonomuraea angiospora TaxID=46172 RepID=UPI0029A5C921|nr:hypothetical protein [Nonomuraea angiospora]MDX3106626.1 hypothetical protein [Nonomuraea angiospora]
MDLEGRGVSLASKIARLVSKIGGWVCQGQMRLARRWAIMAAHSAAQITERVSQGQIRQPGGRAAATLPDLAAQSSPRAAGDACWVVEPPYWVAGSPCRAVEPSCWAVEPS